MGMGLEASREVLLAEAVLKAGVVRARRRGVVRVFTDTFSALDAMRVWMADRLVQSVLQAVLDGNLLVKLGVFQHVAGKRDFGAGTGLFRVASGWSLREVLSEGAAEGEVHRSWNRDEKLLEQLSASRLAVTRRTRAGKFRNCFVAREAIHYWVTSGYVPNTARAIQAGRRMMCNGLIRHVLDCRPFENSGALYWVVDPQENDEDPEDEGRSSRFSNLIGTIIPSRNTFTMESPEDRESSRTGSQFMGGLYTLRKNMAPDLQAYENPERRVPFFEDRSVPFFDTQTPFRASTA